MPIVSPKVVFYISLIIAVTTIGSDPAMFNHAIPDSWIPIVAAWNNIITKLGLALITTLTGMATSQQSRMSSVRDIPLGKRLDAVAASPDVKSIVTTSQLANSTESDKIVDNKK